MLYRLMIAALLLAASPSPAPAQTALERIEPQLARAIEEYRVLLTCSSMEAQTADGIRAMWTGMIAEARARLVNRYVPLAGLAAFDRRTAPEAVRMPPDTPLSRVVALCTVEHPDWLRRLQQLQVTYRIDDALP